MTARLTSAKSVGLVSCHDCHLLVKGDSLAPGAARCPRCGASLHPRKPGSIARAWALLLAAAIMYIPANVLPMTITSALGSVQADTIMSGVIYFMHSGSWEIAAVIFIASIFVPMAKLAILIFLLVSVQLRSRWRPRDRTVLYRITELAGRWSMVDVYVVTILVALVKLGAVASIEAGPAAVYFACVVVLTMLAAESFDPRIIWDVIEEDS
ncbi:paraquat-inducible protein A [Desulfomicrobium sp. ZS1]|jgi:paraquat-inducible protein A|uniref:paraquat-inducible protein A n=1 Tax=Desulfomicrobium sp. ZS1 TaxID=2952228 RepID=UPI0020B3A992|nr:paraquat-inducible protein A [Desulfomicrobium sp. ZS1]UTF49131.1 paraquat-inducible protein A [Desulfomicrobium sp. ZS1]